jgi:hypothetical protein
MGYDHSWKLDVPFTEVFLNDVNKVVEKYKEILESVTVSEDAILFNGVDEKGYETFHLRPKQGNWCKTDAREYDEPVCMILLLAIYHFEEHFYVGSAGLSLDKEQFKNHQFYGYWNEALEEVEKMFGYTFDVIEDIDEDEEEEDEEYKQWYSAKFVPKK